MGILKTDKRLAIEKADLISLLKDNSLDEIALMFNCSVYMVHQEMNRRFEKLKIGFKKEPIINEDFKAIDSWMLSKERKSLDEYKPIKK